MPNTKKILVVEDEMTLQAAVAKKLSIEGFDVLKASNGKEGLESAIENKPDLILLDIVMPEMSGIEMMKQLRESSSWGRHVPIILLTNLAPDDEETINAITKYKPSFYIIKAGSQLSDLMQKIRGLIGG